MRHHHPRTLLAVGENSRQTVCASLGLLLGFALIGCSKANVLQSSPARAENLVVICIDTLRADHLGAYGYRRDTTPSIDRLASQGTVFERTIAQSNWTVPSTATILTSLYPSEHGARIEAEPSFLGKTNPSQLRAKVQTLGDILRAHGLRTGLFSANPYLQGRLARGFQVAEVKYRTAADLTSLALNWVERAPTERFFLYLQYMDLHDPLKPPDAYFEYFETPDFGPRRTYHGEWRFIRARTTDQNRAFRSFRAHRVAVYDGALRYIDGEIGRLLSGLARAGVLDQSLVVVTSDHGEEFWDHAETERELQLDPRRIWGVGHGHSMFQELIHVPLILAGPNVPSRFRFSFGSRQLDIAPTVVKLLGLPPDPQFRGNDLSKYWAVGGERKALDGAVQIAETTAYGPRTQAIIWQGFKLISIGETQLLFDLGDDPDERRNIAEENPEMVDLLRARMANELASTEPLDERYGVSEVSEFDDETQLQLRALGYLAD